jgi:hypothetical protein
MSLLVAICASIFVNRREGLPLGCSVTVVGAGLLTVACVQFGVMATKWVAGYSPHTLSASNLKQLALACNLYHHEQGSFPPSAVYSPDGKPLLSWRVLVLPQLGYHDLYRAFRLDEPWDSPHNLQLLDKMPQEFAAPYETPSHVTPYQVFVGPGAAFEAAKGLKLADFTDGPEETILIIEAPPVPWTKPQDLAYVPGHPLPKIGGLRDRLICAAMADGSVQVFPIEISEATLQALITRNAGDKPGSDWFDR